MTSHAALLWIVLLCIFSGFIVLSYSIFTVAKKNTLDDYILAKFLLLIGLFLIIGGFITMSIIFLLGNSTINTGLTTTTIKKKKFSINKIYLIFARVLTKT
ncbi:MAG: hypothetical protein ACTSQL_13005 [Promethearchaeota archaeon]